MSKRPFRDNTINFSQGLASVSSFLSILIAALPFILPIDKMPDFFSCTLVMWITTAGTAVLVVAAVLDSICLFLGQGVQLVGLVTRLCFGCKIGGPCGAVVATIISALWVRFQLIFLTRSKAAADARVANAKVRAHQEKEPKDAEKQENDGEMARKKECAEYTGLVKRMGALTHHWNEQFFVLENGQLKTYKLDNLQHHDGYKWDHLKPHMTFPCAGIGSWNAAGTVTDDSSARTIFFLVCPV